VGDRIRLVTADDAGPLADLLSVNRAFLAPWEPLRGADYATEESQSRDIAAALARHDEGGALPYVILDQGRVVGRITVSDIVRGPFQSGHLGYWVAEAYNGRGLASAAVAAMLEIGFGEAALHRIQAGTLVHNLGSQRVLQRNGFERIGLAPRYLRIAGLWQDHILYQRLNDALV
jgi:[ribosomal protein S5]-alanine N-acetyltransferase